MQGLLSQELLSKSSLFGSSSGSNIKSVQRGSVTIDSTSSIDINVSTVDVSKSILIVHFRNGWQYTNAVALMGTIINSTTIRLSTGSTTYNLVAKWQLIEFKNIKSLQSGILSSSTGSAVTATISSVALEKSFVIGSWKTTESSMDTTKSMTYNLELTNATTVTYTPYNVGTCTWFVVEFY